MHEDMNIYKWTYGEWCTLHVHLPCGFSICFLMTISGMLRFSALTPEPQTAVVVTLEHDGAARI